MKFVGGYRNNLYMIFDTETLNVKACTKTQLRNIEKTEHIVGIIDGEVSIDDFLGDISCHLLVDSTLTFTTYAYNIMHFGEKIDDAVSLIYHHMGNKLPKILESYINKILKDEALSYLKLVQDVLLRASFINILDLTEFTKLGYDIKFDLNLTSKCRVIKR